MEDGRSREEIAALKQPERGWSAGEPAPSAESTDLLLNEVVFMRAAEIGTGAVGDLVGREQPGGLNDGALAMDPLGLDGLEPRTLDRQIAGREAHPLALLVDLLVMAADPGSHHLADMPGGVVPDQAPDA